MWRNLLGGLVVVWGLTAAAFFAWCQHRASFSVVLLESGWPRPWPYPDAWLARWYARLDAEHPVPPGHVKPEGELYRLQSQLRAYTLSSIAVFAIGVALLLWPRDRHSSQRHSVQRGVAVGLVVGVIWAAAVAHLSDDSAPAEWTLLAIYALGLAITGAAVGAVGRFPELVGMATGLLTVAALAAVVGRHEDGLLVGWPRERVVREFLAASAPGVDWVSFWPMVIGGAGLLAGSVIGVLYRLSRTTHNDEPTTPADPPISP
jgi:hypothetical protein